MKFYRVFFGAPELCYWTDVSATDTIHALCAAAAKLARDDRVPMVTLWNAIYFGNVRVKPLGRKQLCREP